MSELGYLRSPKLKAEAPLPQSEAEVSTKKVEVLAETPEEELLTTREAISKEELAGGVNVTKLLSLKDDGRAIFKPMEGESWSRDNIDEGTYFQRERAAYLVDRICGFNLIPPTVIRTEEGKIGSCQQFVESGKTTTEELYENMRQRFNTDDVLDIEFEEFQQLKAEPFVRYSEDFKRLYALDYILWNSDRHNDNFLIKDGKIIPIDHGLCFGNAKPLFANEPFDQPFPADVIEKLQGVVADTEKVELLRVELKKHLTDTEVAACVMRIKKLALILSKHGQIPRQSAGDLTY